MKDSMADFSKDGRRDRWPLFFALALVVHVCAFWAIQSVAVLWPEPPSSDPAPLRVTLLSPSEVAPVEEEPPPLDAIGQIVEVAPVEDEQTPEAADYLAEYDRKVIEETRSERYRLNPEILSPEWSEEDEREQEEAEASDVEDPDQGATVGTERFDPDRDGRLAAVKATWEWTNRVGDAAPVNGSAASSSLQGAPQNDRLLERRADKTQLNTKEYLYAGYLARVRRLVNFYWQQHIDSLPGSVRLSRPAYTTHVNAVLDGQGMLEHVEVITSSSSHELDACVTRAFRVAGPYPNPPEGLVELDGRVYLPTMGFTVQLGVARARYQGIDPRAGVQFPGILKSPR